MASERIDIQVTDKVAASIEKKLLGIAAAAEKGSDWVLRLQANMAAINGNSVTRLAAEANTATAALQRQAAATQKLASAQHAAAATASTTATSTARATSSTKVYGAAVDSTAAKLRAAKGAQDSFNASTVKGGQATKMAGHHTANLVAQLNDIGVSLASGQNPFIVMIQQGSQLQDLSMRVNGGFKTLFMTTLRLVAPFAAVAGVIGLVTQRFIAFKNEVNDEAGLKNYVKTLGLTKQELKELENVQVTATDVMKGAWMTFKEVLPIDDVLDAISNAFTSTMDFLWGALKRVAFSMVAIVKGTANTMVFIWNNLGKLASEAFYGLANATISAIEWMVNKAIQGINFLAEQANSVLGAVGLEPFGKMAEVTLGRFENKAAGTWKQVADVMVSSSLQAYDDQEKGYDKFLDRTSKNAQKAARERLAAQAKGIIDDRSASGGGAGKKTPIDRSAENRAAALNKVNLELDNEITRMKMLKDERAIQQRYDQIEEQLAGKKIKLSQTEAAAIREKIVAIEAYKYVQAESDRIMEDAIGPARTMNAAVEAATTLYDAGQISVERYTEELRKATREHDKAVDPLFAMNEELTSSARIANAYGVELERVTYLEGVRQTLADKGKSIYDASTNSLTAEVAALVATNDALRQQQFIQSQLGDVLNPILEQQRVLGAESLVYAELQRLRDNDLINEDAYQRAKLELQNKYSEMRLSSMSSFFGDLAEVTARGNGAVGVVSKAAAVAQATIDGFVATQKALASAPPPWNFIAAAGVALKTGANVAGILSTNVGSFATGGQFTVGGKSGIDANNINMNVTKGERVTIETMKQQRANDNGPAAAPVIKQKIVNQFDVREFVSAMDSDDGEEVVMNIISRRKADVAQITAGGAG